MADLMNPGGGLTKSKLLLANANPSDVSQRKSFYSNGSKELQTGTLVERGTSQNAGGIGSGGSGSSAYIALNRIPEGIYRSNGEDWSPEIRINEDTLINYIVDNYRSKVINRLNLNLTVRASAYLGTAGSTPKADGGADVYQNGVRIGGVGITDWSMNSGVEYATASFKIT